jgi:hypothetical protein
MTTINKIFKFLKEKNLSNDEFFLLYRKISNEYLNLIDIPLESLIMLQDNKWIKITNEDKCEYELRVNSKKLFTELDEYMNKETIEQSKDWVQEYRELFKGKKVGAMGDPNECKKKLVDFLAQNPAYDKEIIIKATQKYINIEAQSNYKYLQQADYFILKNNKSRLLAFCEEVEDGEEVEKKGFVKMI